MWGLLTDNTWIWYLGFNTFCNFSNSLTFVHTANWCNSRDWVSCTVRPLRKFSYIRFPSTFLSIGYLFRIVTMVHSQQSWSLFSIRTLLCFTFNSVSIFFFLFNFSLRLPQSLGETRIKLSSGWKFSFQLNLFLEFNFSAKDCVWVSNRRLPSRNSCTVKLVDWKAWEYPCILKWIIWWVEHLSDYSFL